MSAQARGYVEFSVLVSQLVRNLKLLDRDQKTCCGVTMPQCYTIEILAQLGSASMHELSRQMGVAESTMTRIIDILVRDRVVARKSNPEDRRKVCVELTKRGKEMSKELRACADNYSTKILERVPAEKRQDVMRALRLLTDAIEKVKGQFCDCA